MMPKPTREQEMREMELLLQQMRDRPGLRQGRPNPTETAEPQKRGAAREPRPLFDLIDA